MSDCRATFRNCSFFFKRDCFSSHSWNVCSFVAWHRHATIFCQRHRFPHRWSRPWTWYRSKSLTVWIGLHLGLSKKGDQKSSHKIGFEPEAIFLASHTKKLSARISRQIKSVPETRTLPDIVPCSSPVISFEALHQIERNKVLEIYIQHSKQKKQ